MRNEQRSCQAVVPASAQRMLTLGFVFAFAVAFACACNGNERKTETPSASAPPGHASDASAADVSAAGPNPNLGTRKFPKEPHAPFAIAFVVDQLSAWVAEERFPLLPETGGFARLRREGTW